MQINRFAISIAIWLGFGVSSAQASPVSWNFSGDVVNVSGDGSYFSDLGVAIGDSFSGSLSFDPTAGFNTNTFSTGVPGAPGFTQQITTPFLPGNAVFSNVKFFTSNGTVSYSSGFVDGISRVEQRINTNGGVANETVGTTIDTFTAQQFDSSLPSLTDRLQVFRLIDELNGGLFNLDGFISTPPSLDDLILGRYFLRELDGNGVGQSVDTRLTSVASVPEPGALALLLFGATPILLRRRQRALKI